MKMSSSQLPRARIHPDWLAHRYDPTHDAVHFLEVQRHQRRAAPFLTDAELKPTSQPLVIRRDAAMEMLPPPQPVHFIFHSAYCCSTLLANALDLPSVSSTLKEPVLLNDLAGWRHRGGDSESVNGVLDDALRLLARPFSSDEAMLIKPSNLLNALATPMMTLQPMACCVLLYAPLRIYLGSIAQKGLWGRLWVRDLLAKQMRDGIADFGLSIDERFLLTDLQVAAIGWLAQHRMFAALARRYPDRVRTLNSEILLDRPIEALQAIGTLFDLPIGTPMATEIAFGDTFTRNAKDGRQFGLDNRKTDQVAARDVHGAELGMVETWALRVAEIDKLNLVLPSPLLPHRT